MRQFRLLGDFTAESDGARVKISSVPARALLAYLLLNPEKKHNREKLCSLLWPDAGLSKGRAYLRQYLWQLGKSLGKDFFAADGESIAIAPDAAYSLDVEAFIQGVRQAATADELAQLIKVHSGELLVGHYDNWVLAERDKLKVVRQQALQGLLAMLEAQYRWPEVLEWGEYWIALGETPEPAYRALLRAYAALGDSASLASVYQRCTVSLQEELGVAPSPETRRLYEELLQGKLPEGLKAEAPPSAAATRLEATGAEDDPRPRPKRAARWLPALLLLGLAFFAWRSQGDKAPADRASSPTAAAAADNEAAQSAISAASRMVAYDENAPVVEGLFELVGFSGTSFFRGDIDMGFLDQDPLADVVVSSDQSLLIYFNLDLAAEPALTLDNGRQVTAIAIGDLDLDGDEDLVAASPNGPTSLWLNDGDGQFELGEQLSGTQSWDIVLADLDGDGDLDLYDCVTGPNVIWLNNGRGHFSPDTSTPVRDDSVAAAAGDLDLDGDIDMVVGNINFEAALWENHNDGVFFEFQSLAAQSIEDLTLADINGDGYPDLLGAVRNGSGEAGDFENEATPNLVLFNQLGQLRDSGQSLGNGYSVTITSGDLDRDGDLDVFVGNGETVVGSQRHEVWLNDGLGNFTLYYFEDDPSLVAVDALLLDVDQDGWLDVLLLTDDHGLALLRHSGNWQSLLAASD